MHIYYLYNLLLFLLYPFLRWRLTLFIMLTYPFFLLYLPETGFDFAIYQLAYESIYFDSHAPLFFRSSASITAEPGWFLYTGIIHTFISDFRYFLVFNFIICMVIFLKTMKVLGIERNRSALMIALLVPICLITIMFWSPRSALPFMITILAISYLHSGLLILPIILSLTAITIHSQYAVILMLSIAFYVSRTKRTTNGGKFILLLLSLIFIAILYFFRMQIVNFISFLPSSGIIAGKLHYLQDSNGAFRVSGILSILVFPLYVFSRRTSLAKRHYFDTVILFSVFSMAINLIFLGNAHIAGRLARASDYYLFSYILADATLYIHRPFGAWVLIPIFTLLPFLFPDLYNVGEIYEALAGNH